MQPIKLYNRPKACVQGRRVGGPKLLTSDDSRFIVTVIVSNIVRRIFKMCKGVKLFMWGTSNLERGQH